MKKLVMWFIMPTDKEAFEEFVEIANRVEMAVDKPLPILPDDNGNERFCEIWSLDYVIDELKKEISKTELKWHMLKLAV